ncbi:MAG: IS630 transposase-related protein [Nitrososphaerota archaeon]|nr:IS630 transposase-related protein [Nitrososphaerota archaeon]
MPKPITVDEREKIIRYKWNGEKEVDIARWLFVSESSVTKLWALYRRTGSWMSKYENCGRNPALKDTQIIQIKIEVEKNPDITLLELIEKYDLPISESGLSKVFKKLGLTFKKRHFMQTNKNEQTQ